MEVKSARLTAKALVLDNTNKADKAVRCFLLSVTVVDENEGTFGLQQS